MLDITLLKSFLERKTLYSPSYILVIEDEGELKYYERVNQPCWGELRTYKVIHDDYSNPLPEDSYRPGDLKHPFPMKGRPFALAAHFIQYSTRVTIDLVDPILSNESPWVNAFGGADKVIRHGQGAIFTDMDVDPTVLVNMLSVLNSLGSSWEIMVAPLKDKLPTREFILLSLAISAYASSSSGSMTYNGHVMTNYYLPSHWNIKRFLGQSPHDLTGGSFKDRYAYNRKILHEVFGRGYKSPEETVNITSIFQKHLDGKVFDLEEVLTVWNKYVMER